MATYTRHAFRKFSNEGRNERCDQELAYAIEKSKTLSANAKHRYSKSNAKAHTPTPTPTKKEGNGQKANLDANGFVAYPDSEEFKKWKAWAFEHQVTLWRELQQRETEGRAFNFERQWPEIKH